MLKKNWSKYIYKIKSIYIYYNILKFVVVIMKREAGGQGEFSVGLAARRDVASQPAT